MYGDLAYLLLHAQRVNLTMCLQINGTASYDGVFVYTHPQSEVNCIPLKNTEELCISIKNGLFFLFFSIHFF